MQRCIAVFTTVSDPDQARRIAGELVERRLAACVQICAIESCYRWEGRLRQEPEQRLLIKTTAERYAEVEATIRELHSYELPAIHAVALDEIYAPYAAWIGDNVRRSER